jgi:hypothetical protein
VAEPPEPPIAGFSVSSLVSVRAGAGLGPATGKHSDAQDGLQAELELEGAEPNEALKKGFSRDFSSFFDETYHRGRDANFSY